MYKKKVLKILVTGVLLFSSITGIVHAETAYPVVLGYDLVDSGKHMDYKISSKYDWLDEGAASTWNNYLGSTVIRRDNWGTVNDCNVSDVTRSDVTWAGVTATPSIGIVTGYIQLNTYYMDQYTSTKQATVIKHEFGHTLGCGENSCSDLNIMYPSAKYGNIELTIHDKASVDLAKKSW